MNNEIATRQPGWYPKPDDEAILAWWDGEDWSRHTTPAALGVPRHRF